VDSRCIEVVLKAQWIGKGGSRTGSVPKIYHSFGVSISVSDHDENLSKVETFRC
jgi:hypothetical protein